MGESSRKAKKSKVCNNNCGFLKISKIKLQTISAEPPEFIHGEHQSILKVVLYGTMENTQKFIRVTDYLYHKLSDNENIQLSRFEDNYSVDEKKNNNATQNKKPVLNFLGRGSAFNIKEGNTSAYIIQNKKLLLIDCGENIFERIIARKILENVDSVNILITHLNSDHVGSLSSFIHFCHYIKHLIPTIYYPQDDVSDFLKMQGHKEGCDFNFKYTLENKESIFDFGSIIPVRVKHIDQLNCFGYILYLKNTIIWYSGDCSIVPSVLKFYNIEQFYQDTCLLDYEGNFHTSLRVLCEAFPIEKRGQVYCMHIDSNELIKQAKHKGFNVVMEEMQQEKLISKVITFCKSLLTKFKSKIMWNERK